MRKAPGLDNLYRGFVPPPRTESVAPGVFATIYLDGSWGLSNAGFVVDSGEVCVIDTFLTADRTRRFQDEIRRRTGADTVKYVINTHHHCDHTFGNYIFEDAVVIGHATCRKQVLSVGLSPMAKDPFVPWGEIRLRPPEVTFEDRLQIYVGSIQVDLIHVGPAHTRDNVLVWLPDTRVLFAGDVLFHSGTPILTDGSVAASIAVLDFMESLNPSVIVPGHGELAGISQIDDWRAYFDFLSTAATDATERGITPLEAARALELGEFAAWVNPERIVLNLHRAMAEIGGASPGHDLDSAMIFADMLRFEPAAYGHKLIEGLETYVEVDS